MSAEFFMCIVSMFGFGACFILSFRNMLASRRTLQGASCDDKPGQAPKLIVAMKCLGEALSPYLRRVMRKKAHERIKVLLASAGLTENIEADSFEIARVSMAFGSSLFAIVVLPFGFISSFIIGAAFGYFYPLLSLLARVKRRRLEITTVLPGMLDWLALSVEAGLDFAQALDRITQRMRDGALKEELLSTCRAIRMGNSRKDALSQMAKRIGLKELSSFVAILVQAEMLGASITPVLKSAAARMRAERFARAERKGVAASQKALIPLAICIMPSTFVVVFGPLIVRLVTGGFEAMFR